MTPKKHQKIIVLDDDRPITEALEIALSVFGFDVLTTNRTIEFMPMVTKFKPDLVIIDYFLAGEAGTDLVAKLRKKNTTSDIKIIMFSAHPSAKDEIDLKQVNAFVAKPFDIESLVRKINNLLS